MDADAESDDAIPQSPSSPVATLRSNAIAPIRNQYKRKYASATTSGDATMELPISFEDLPPDDALLIDSSKAASADEGSDDDGDSAYDMSVYGIDMRELLAGDEEEDSEDEDWDGTLWRRHVDQSLMMGFVMHDGRLTCPSLRVVPSAKVV